jgi:signal peptidase complex subunit 3
VIPLQIRTFETAQSSQTSQMMDSYSNRTSSIFTTFTTVLFTFATLNHLTYYFHPTSPTATVRVSREHNLVFSEFKNYNAEQVKFDLDISVDLRTEYSWNVNQLYLFVVASYETAKNTRNEVVVFDKILREKKDYKFDLKQQKVKYLLRDEFKNTLAGKKVTLAVKYQVMPVFGVMQMKEIQKASSELVVPKEYSKK